MPKLSACDQDSDRSSEVAFQAWLRAKAKQRREELKRSKSDTAEAGQVGEKKQIFLGKLLPYLILLLYTGAFNKLKILLHNYTVSFFQSTPLLQR